MQSDYENALAYFQKAENIARQHALKSVLLGALGNRGLVEFNLGQMENALRNAEEGYRLANELNDRFHASALLGNIGNIYLEQGKYAQAFQHYNQSLNIAQEIGDRQGVSIGIGNMGNVYLRYGMYPQALACFTKNLQISLEIGDTAGVGFTAWNIASAYLGERQLAGAQELAQRAITIDRLLDTPYELCEALHTLGKILAARGRYEEALEPTREALQIAQEIGYGEIHFQAAVGEVRLLLALKHISAAEAVRRLQVTQEQFRDEHGDDIEAAEVAYRIWKFDTAQEEARQQAADLYKALYAQTPNAEYRNRYRDLTGEDLPEPPALPPLPESVTEGLPHLTALLDAVDALIAELRGEQEPQ
jgi:tetratricopeptide (TPR) repeat protein